MIGEIAHSHRMGADAVDIGKTTRTHAGREYIGMAAVRGSCADVPPAHQ